MEKSWRKVIREEWEKLSKLTWRQRIGYVWDYYKALMVAILVMIAAIYMGVTIYHNLQLEELLSVYLLNCNSVEIDSGEMVDGFTEYLGGLKKNEVITIDASLALGEEQQSNYGLASQVKFTALLSDGDMDILLLTPELFEIYQKDGCFADLTDVLSSEQLQKWEDYLISAEDAQDGSQKWFGLNVQFSPVIQQYHAYYGEPVYAAVMINAKHTDLCDEFLEYLMKVQ